jgi:hypothetical protein
MFLNQIDKQIQTYYLCHEELQFKSTGENSNLDARLDIWRSEVQIPGFKLRFPCTYCSFGKFLVLLNHANISSMTRSFANLNPRYLCLFIKKFKYVRASNVFLFVMYKEGLIGIKRYRGNKI